METRPRRRVPPLPLGRIVARQIDRPLEGRGWENSIWEADNRNEGGGERLRKGFPYLSITFPSVYPKKDLTPRNISAISPLIFVSVRSCIKTFLPRDEYISGISGIVRGMRESNSVLNVEFNCGRIFDIPDKEFIRGIRRFLTSFRKFLL